ncbi:hypothetical protein C7974DRAFT_415186 [Boeremia exigua]|uniref:uncharacterized protein n=1 Tax=Boeremia exigua TaxID=749465 RepID=UPI001E8CD53E|nr:uncharacterized protein C7974DRAFT_415186 [Boeremia exigua]KAH6619935.1 hypothetical protein C7974DRAFT_415186 [Boeremia exigua]
MAQLQTPPSAAHVLANASSAPAPQTADKEALLARLDALLEQYLHALAQYEVLTQQLGRGMGSGFLALAQANFHSRGPRYGRDSYDGRVQAVRRVAVTATTTATGSESESGREGGTGAGSTETVRFDAFSTLAPRARQRGEDGDGVGEGAAVESHSTLETAQSAAPDTSSTTDPHTTDPPTAPPNPPHTTDTATDTDTDTTPPAPTDPLRMFGVLVPPALRTAQAHFAAAVEGPVVGLASVAAQLRALEREIGRVRKGVRRA